MRGPRLPAVQRAYAFRAYRAREHMRHPFTFGWGVTEPGHPDGGYCLDALPAPTGSSTRADWVYETEVHR